MNTYFCTQLDISDYLMLFITHCQLQAEINYTPGDFLNNSEIKNNFSNQGINNMLC